uniref:Presequence protease, mitochondrial n=1 Tax=Strigamia maritima TaxID=126957 RepID=T1IR04_STRMM
MALIANNFEEKYGNYFDKVATVQAEGVISVTKYRSKRTGLTIFIPMTAPTEAHDDDGLPHTLEHLIFLGSELYPYKGVLDLVANRCLASGTNAWTDIDHTCYTMTTAGAEGFLQLLPIYLDHILFPVLSDAGFTTEVHHINGDGENAGVVYCEMQGRENVDDCVAHTFSLRAIYPEPSGYRCVTGGIMKNLRESTDNEKVKNYHSIFYRSENLGLAIAGQIDVCELLDTILKFEERIISSPPKPEFIRPWQTQVPELPETVEQTVLFPCDEETNGIAVLAWRGPNCKEIEKIEALEMLGEYLCDTSIAPLHKEFVEQDEPYCSGVSNSIITNSEVCIYFWFQDVPVSKLELVKEKLLSTLREIAIGKRSFDLKRLQTLLYNQSIITLRSMESSPQGIITTQLILDFLYGGETEAFEKSLNHISIYRELMTKSTKFWLDLITEYYIDTKFALTIVKPSIEHMQMMSQKEEERIAKQREILGETGLKAKLEKLQGATKQNEIPPPRDMINSIPVPDVNKINHILVRQSSNHMGKGNNNILPLDKIPVCFLLDDCKSNFIHLSAILNTSSLPYNLRLYLPIFCGIIFESPILRDGVLISHESVISQMLEDVFRSNIDVGFPSSFRSCCIPVSGTYLQTLQISLTLETKRYKKGVQWLRELLYFTQFKPDRLKIVANRMLNSISNLKRQGETINRCILTDMSYDTDSNNFACNVLRQQTFLSLLLLKLDSDPDEIVSDLNTLRALITDPEKITIYMAADVDKLSQITRLEEPWLTFPPISKAVPDHTKCSVCVKSAHEFILPINDCSRRKLIVGLGSVESSYLIQSVPCITNYEHPDLPAVMVLLQYFTQTEGPMWRQIRGLGLAYGFSMIVHPENGMLNLNLYECSHATSAYKEAKKILENHINGKEAWDTSLLDSARSSLAFEIISRENTIPNACEQSLLSYFRKVDLDYTKKFLEKVSNVSIDDLARVAPQYVSKLVTAEESRFAVCCHPSKVDEIILAFKELSVFLGQNLDSVPNLEEGFLCSLKKE